jgi:hypothetical protein
MPGGEVDIWRDTPVRLLGSFVTFPHLPKIPRTRMCLYCNYIYFENDFPNLILLLQGTQMRLERPSGHWSILTLSVSAMESPLLTYLPIRDIKLSEST